MEPLRDEFAFGRGNMIDAFVTLSDLAREAGVDHDTITALHGQFFDGNVITKRAFGTLTLLAALQGHH